ncbi:MAG: hypothetical protein EHM28_01300 [Spirochaetaceae bacterium]|nr:MAG: hypothetical protein EHM28_01300 [Spirochaetaceae bacterium]
MFQTKKEFGLKLVFTDVLWVFLSGIFPVIYRIFFRTKRELTLARGSIILKTIHLAFITQTKEIAVADYKGFESSANWRINKRQAYRFKIIGTKNKLSLGPNYFSPEVELLQTTIEKHIGENLIR